MNINKKFAHYVTRLSLAFSMHMNAAYTLKAHKFKITYFPPFVMTSIRNKSHMSGVD